MHVHCWFSSTYTKIFPDPVRERQILFFFISSLPRVLKYQKFPAPKTFIFGPSALLRPCGPGFSDKVIWFDKKFSLSVLNGTRCRFHSKPFPVSRYFLVRSRKTFVWIVLRFSGPKSKRLIAIMPLFAISAPFFPGTPVFNFFFSLMKPGTFVRATLFFVFFFFRAASRRFMLYSFSSRKLFFFGSHLPS